MSGELEAMLASGLAKMGIKMDLVAQERQIAFLRLMAKWNRVYNLTAIVKPEEMVARHLLDSLTLLPWLKGPRVLDAGTGAGLPGIPLAIARPDLHFILADATEKRIRFLREVVRSLGLNNVEPVHARLEDLELQPAPDDIVARALAPLPRLVMMVAHWLEGSSRLLAMKGRLEAAETQGLDEKLQVQVHPLSLPGYPDERCLVIVGAKESETANGR